MRNHALDVLEEAHRQHLVAFVEDEDANVLGVEHATTDEVEDAARGAHDDVHAVIEVGDLLADRRAAVDRFDNDAAVFTEGGHFARDLQREFASR